MSPIKAGPSGTGAACSPNRRLTSLVHRIPGMADIEQDFGALLSPELWRIVIGFLQPDPSAEETTQGSYLARSQIEYLRKILRQ